MTWPSGHDQPAAGTRTCRARPLPGTVRPGRLDSPEPPSVDDRTVFPVHHVAACCVIGAALWAGVITVGRVALDVLLHLG